MLQTLKTCFSSIFLSIVLVTVLAFHSPDACAQETDTAMTGTLKAFVLTSTYGVIAGALTGLASLAFYHTASDHTRNVAIGASLGLYTGILLGAYIVYGPMLNQPSTGEKKEDGSKPVINPDDPINLGASLESHVVPTLSYLPQTGVQLGVIYNF
jgi:hypothetical protein